MSFATQFHVPGAFNFDAGPGPSQPLHANIFRPPPSPSASTYNLAKSTGSLFSDISMSNAPPAGAAKRKRTSARETTSWGWNPNADGADDGRDAGKGREIRYTLAGQISTTPAGATAGADNDLLEDSVYSDVNYRRALGPKTAFDADSPTIQAAERMEDNATSLTGWSLFSLQTIGDMVGKVWEFCRTRAAFRGFHAGGGMGYNVNGSTVTETTGRPWGAEPDTPAQTADGPLINQEGPAYAAQQPPYYSPEYHDLSTPDLTPRPAAKRRQVSANNDELRNWVVVDEPSDQKPRRFAAEVKSAAARTSGLARPRSGYYSQTSLSSHRRISTPSSRFTGATTTRPSLRISHSGSPNLTPHEPASFASPRSSPVSRPTPSRIPVPIQQPSLNPLTIPGTTSSSTCTSPSRTAASRPSSRQSPAAASSRLGSRPPPSPTKTSSHHHRSHSTASAASSSSAAAATTTTTTHHRLLRRRHHHHHDDRSPMPADDMLSASTSPRLDAEARQLAQRRLAAERDADARVDAFNARLLSMIRQGREALGTRVEVEMVGGGEDEDEGCGGRGHGRGGAGGWEDDD